MAFLVNLWNLMLELAPWLFVGTTVACILHVWLPKDFIGRRLGGGGVGEVARAVGFGVPLPLCSCGVIPAALSLRKEGASEGASIGFMISTPQTGVDSVLVTASMLGWPFALFKVAAAVVTGLIGGMCVGWANSAVVSKKEFKASDIDDHRNRSVTWGEAFRYGRDELLYPVWRWLVVGVLVSVAVSTWIPEDQFASLGSGGLWTLLLMVAISLPLYVCATASVPVAASLVASGFPEGAALVFLMAGPATNVATMGAVHRVFGIRVMAVYLSTVLLGSVIFGLIFDFTWGLNVTQETMEHGHDSLFSIGSAVMLCALLGWFAFQDLRQKVRVMLPSLGQETIELRVDGLTCGGCVKSLTSGLESVSGVEAVDVVLDTGSTRVYGAKLNREVLKDAVRKVGFSVYEPSRRSV